MRILFIVPYAPTRIRVRPYSLLKTMVERGHQVTLATLWSSEAERDQLASLERPGLKILAAPLPRLRWLRNCLGALPTPTPLQAVYCWQPSLREALERLLKTEQFDVIHVEHLRGARYGLALKDRGIPVVWDSVDCISHLFEQAVVHSRSRFAKWITRLELGRTRRYEGWLVNQFDTVLVTSEVDKQALIKLTRQQFSELERQLTDQRLVPLPAVAGSTVSGQPLDGNIKVLPNGVDDTYFSPNGPKPEAENLVFSGKMSYHANVTMALHLVHNIMPYVWAERPGVTLTIVGQNPPPSVENLGRDRQVIVTGYVADIRPYLQRATVAVAPATYGAGIQNKVLEAMACGIPVVATEQAISALKLKPERDILVADDAETLARQVLRLLQEPNLREIIGRNGHNYVKNCHSWPQIGNDLETIYQVVIEKTNEAMDT